MECPPKIYKNKTRKSSSIHLKGVQRDNREWATAFKEIKGSDFLKTQDVKLQIQEAPKVLSIINKMREKKRHEPETESHYPTTNVWCPRETEVPEDPEQGTQEF